MSRLLVFLVAILVGTTEAVAVPTPVAPVKPLGRMITLSDFGAEDLGYLAIPAAPPKVGLVLVPDAYGLDDFTKSEALRLAGLGYLVVAVDIYNGRHPIDATDVTALVNDLNTTTVITTIDAGIRVFHESPKFRVDRVIAVGWGVGARFVYQEARENKLLDGAVTFYGPAESDPARLERFHSPLCALYSDRDPVTPRETVLSFQRAMRALGNDCSAWFIAAESGWSNPISKSFSPGEDREAWRVALPFIERIGAVPSEDKPKDKGPSVIDKIKNIFE